jgi:fructokinase
VSVDPNLRPTSWPSVMHAVEAMQPLLEAADILKVNDEEARLITGKNDVDAALRALAGRAGRLAVITLGSEGCIWRLDDKAGNASAPAVEVVDTTGAGDAFVGALLADLYARSVRKGPLGTLSQTEVAGAMHFACAAAAVSCTQAGAMPALPTRRQVESLLGDTRG